VLQTLEAKSKKQAFVSHGDFRQYLYEATIFAMPCTKATNETAEIRLFYHFSHKLGFSIIVQLEKIHRFSSTTVSEKNNSYRFNLWQNKPEYWLSWRKGLNDKSLSCERKFCKNLTTL